MFSIFLYLSLYIYIVYGFELRVYSFRFLFTFCIIHSISICFQSVSLLMSTHSFYFMLFSPYPTNCYLFALLLLIKIWKVESLTYTDISIWQNYACVICMKSILLVTKRICVILRIHVCRCGRAIINRNGVVPKTKSNKQPPTLAAYTEACSKTIPLRGM